MSDQEPTQAEIDALPQTPKVPDRFIVKFYGKQAIEAHDIPALLRHMASVHEQKTLNQDLGAEPSGSIEFDMNDRTFAAVWSDQENNEQVQQASHMLKLAEQTEARVQEQIDKAVEQAVISERERWQHIEVPQILAAAGRADFDWRAAREFGHPNPQPGQGETEQEKA
jgi:hypothetical protein